MVAFIQNSVDALSLGSLYALAALGIGLLFGMLRLINFAHGDFITIGAFGLIVPSRNDIAMMAVGSLPVILLVPAACAIVVIAALLSDRLVFRPLRTASAPTLMVASFSVGYIIQNTILVVYGARPKTIDLWSSLGEQLHFGAVRIPRLEVVTIGVTLVLMAALTAFLKRTRYGVQIRAAAEDFLMARYLGVKANFGDRRRLRAVGHSRGGGIAAFRQRDRHSDQRHGGTAHALRVHRDRCRRHGQPGRRSSRRVHGRVPRGHASGLSAGRPAPLPRCLRVRYRCICIVGTSGRHHPDQGAGPARLRTAMSGRYPAMDRCDLVAGFPVRRASDLRRHRSIG